MENSLFNKTLFVVSAFVYRSFFNTENRAFAIDVCIKTGMPYLFLLVQLICLFSDSKLAITKSLCKLTFELIIIFKGVDSLEYFWHLMYGVFVNKSPLFAILLERSNVQTRNFTSEA